MKQKNKKQNSKASTPKKTSYIGVLTFIVAGLISLLSIRYTTRLILPSEKQLTVTLPPAPSAESLMQAPEVPPAEVPESPQASVPEAAPVAAQPIPFSIIRPAQGDIIKPFSIDTLLYSKTMSDWRTHTGIDFSAAVTNEVVAAADGTVERVYTDPFMGQTIVILHQDNFRTLYQNLAPDIAVTEGDTVSQGQAIGICGSSAPVEFQDVPHLHFALTQNDEFIHPLDYLSVHE